MDPQSLFFMFLSMTKSQSSNDMATNYLFMISLLFFGILSKFISSMSIYDIQNFFKRRDHSIRMDIPTYQIPVIRSCSKVPQTKYVYSNRFLAVSNFLREKHIDKFMTLTEAMTDNKELNCAYYSEDDEQSKSDKITYALIPFDNKHILIHSNPSIYCDFNLQEDSQSSTDSDDKKGNDSKISFQKSKKLYLISLYIKKEDTCNGKYNMEDIDKFVNECVLQYELSKRKSNNVPYIYHFRCSEKSEDNLDLKFEEDVFETSKDIHKNIFFEGKETIVNLIKPFINDVLNKDDRRFEKYDLCGKPRCFNMLLCGAPGCGKTSFIKSIIKETKRTAININLSNVKTCQELELIFKQKRINGRDYLRSELIYILEDFDAMNSDFLHSRKKEDECIPEQEKPPSPTSEIAQFVKLFDPMSVKSGSLNEDAINLSCFLNILDGIIELHEGMVIMTTNHPEKLDPAVYRPGRVDWYHEFTYATKKTIVEMLKVSFKLSDEEMAKYDVDSLDIKDGILSPAYIQQICFLNTDVQESISQIVAACQKQMKEVDKKRINYEKT
jgi:DNA replication protein DnaC